jgi:hypothetical protein
MQKVTPTFLSRLGPQTGDVFLPASEAPGGPAASYDPLICYGAILV